MGRSLYRQSKRGPNKRNEDIEEDSLSWCYPNVHLDLCSLSCFCHQLWVLHPKFVSLLSCSLARLGLIFSYLLFFFFLFTVEDSPLTSDKAFVSLSLFNLLQFPLTMLPNVITAAVEARFFFNPFFAPKVLNKNFPSFLPSLFLFVPFLR